MAQLSLRECAILGARLPRRGPPERHIYSNPKASLNLSDYAQEEERLRKLYDQARAQGNRKKKKEYKEKLAELNRLRKYSPEEEKEAES